MSKLKKSCQKNNQKKVSENRGVARIERSLVNRDLTLSTGLPVDTNNSNIISSDSLKPINKKDKKAAQIKVKNHNNKSVSFDLRSLFLAIAEINGLNPSARLAFVTVNLSMKVSRKLLANSKKATKSYAINLNNRFKAGLRTKGLHLKEQPSFFLVLEDSRDKSLHAHIIISHHPDDKDTLNKMFRKDTANHNNDVVFQYEYRLWLNALPDSDAWMRNELDLEYDQHHQQDDKLCIYPGRAFNKHGQERFYTDVPVDIGSADYMSKDLEKPFQAPENSFNELNDPELRPKKDNRVYRQQHVGEVAKRIYDNACQAAVNNQPLMEKVKMNHTHQDPFKAAPKLNTFSELKKLMREAIIQHEKRRVESRLLGEEIAKDIRKSD